MINFAANLNKMIDAGLGGPLDPPRTEVAVGHRVVYTEVSGDVVNFETNVIAPVKNLRVTMEPIQAGSGDPSPENIRPISGRDTVRIWREAAYDPDTAPAVTVALGQTVYSGTLDVTAGTMTVDKAYALLNDPDEWIAYAGSVANYQYRPRFDNHKFGSRAVSVSSAFPVYALGLPLSIGWLNASNSPYIGIVDTNSVLTLSDIKEMASNNEIAIVYELSEPQTIQLTPAQLTTLNGQNNVWSDAGNISLEYPCYEETEGY